MLTCNRSQTFHKVVSEKFAEVQQKMESKVSQMENKENLDTLQSTPTAPTKSLKSSQQPVQIESPDLEELKIATRQKILHIINRGNIKGIMTLKTIGKKRAEQILNAREEHGDYLSIEDLQIAGLKESQISTLFKANLDL